MPKETVTLTRDLFDEMLIAVATKERERIIKLLEEEGSNLFALNYLVTIIKAEQ